MDEKPIPQIKKSDTAQKTGRLGLYLVLISFLIMLCAALGIAAGFTLPYFLFVSLPFITVPLSCISAVTAAAGAVLVTRSLKTPGPWKVVDVFGIFLGATVFLVSGFAFIAALSFSTEILPVEDYRFTQYDEYSAAVFSPDGNEIALLHHTGNNYFKETYQIELVDVNTGKLNGILSNDAAATSYFLFSPDGKLLAGINDQDLTIWDMDTHNKLYANAFSDHIESVVFSKDGATITLIQRNSGAIVLQAPDFETKEIIPLGELIPRNGFTVLGSYILYEDNEALQASIFRIPDFVADRYSLPLVSFPMEENLIYRPSVSQDETLFASAVQTLGTNYHSEIQVWDIQTAEMIQSIQLDPPADPDDAKFTSVEFSPDGQTLAYTSDGKSLTLVDLKTFKSATISGIRKIEEGGFSYFSFSPDGRRILFEYPGNGFILWNLDTNQKEWGFPASLP